MKFMKLGTRPDTFYAENATRTLLSDLPSDLVIKINNITYLLHKYPLVPKCGLLQRLCSGSDDSEKVTIELHDIPGGEDAFELCAKFCYGITISLSAHNFVSAICAAKFLRMTESVEKGNFVLKLEAFFNSCILEGWRDSIVTLKTTADLPEWSENLGIIRRCIDSVAEKILTPPSKVTWSFTYTRPGYVKKHQSVPRDWWTEDISDLDIDLFRCIVIAIRATNMLSPQLIGEALHVYATRWLPDIAKIRHPDHSSSSSQTDRDRRVLESIVSMIPAERGSVSTGFLLRLFSIANYIDVSRVTKTELIRRSSLQLDEATVEDLLLPLHSSPDHHFYDIDLVGTVLQSYLSLWRRKAPAQPSEDSPFLRSIRRVGKLIDSYLQMVSRDANMPVLKVVSLAEALPDIARAKHDDLYKAINTYLKEHPDLRKSEKKRLCQMLDCQKLSSEVCAHAVKNERLPLRTVVQVLFFEQERGAGSSTTQKQHQKLVEIAGDKGQEKAKLSPEEQVIMSSKGSGRPKTKTIEEDHHKMKMSDGKLERNVSASKLEPKKVMQIKEKQVRPWPGQNK